MLIIFLFLRNFRSTLIVCTSIPISVIGTFALLYFGGFTLNTMTFGGLALGVGMIVDASIVVLENTFRHMEHGKDRMQASIDGSEEVWSAILASILTHIAVFVPLLFLTGVSSIMFRQLSVVVMFSLAMSLFVAVTIVPVLCSRLLKLPPPASERTRARRPALHVQRDGSSNGMDDGYRRLIHLALHHRPTVIGVGTALRRRRRPDPADDRLRADAAGRRGRGPGDRGAAGGHARSSGPRTLRCGSKALAQGVRAGSDDVIDQGRRRRRLRCGGGGGNRAQHDVRLVPKDERTRSSEQIARDLNRQLPGVIPGVIITHARLGRQPAA